jgi:hypothetical protein
MANIVPITNEIGDVVDYNYYCSDFCAKQDPNYAGWFGCVENYSAPFCNNCETPLFWIDENDYSTYLGKEKQNV